MNRFEQLNSRVVAWAGEKGILSKATPLAQCNKTLEEVIELSLALSYQYIGDKEFIKDKEKLVNTGEEIQDALGDILVTILIQAKMQNLDLLDCLESALDIIEKRTGKMIDGQFVKDK